MSVRSPSQDSRPRGLALSLGFVQHRAARPQPSRIPITPPGREFFPPAPAHQVRPAILKVSPAGAAASLSPPGAVRVPRCLRRGSRAGRPEPQHRVGGVAVASRSQLRRDAEEEECAAPAGGPPPLEDGLLGEQAGATARVGIDARRVLAELGWRRGKGENGREVNRERERDRERERERETERERERERDPPRQVVRKLERQGIIPTPPPLPVVSGRGEGGE